MTPQQRVDKQSFYEKLFDLEQRIQGYVTFDSVDLVASVNSILDDSREIIGFNCGEYFAIVNEDGSLPKPGEIENPLDEQWFIKWITGVNYDSHYMELGKNSPLLNIKNMAQGPPRSLFNPEFNFKELVILDNVTHMKFLEEQHRLMQNYLNDQEKKFKKDFNPNDYPRGFSEFVYQIDIPATRPVGNRQEMYGLFIFDTPLFGNDAQIDMFDVSQMRLLHTLPTEQTMEKVKKIVALTGKPIAFKAYAEELKQAYSALEAATEQIAQSRAKEAAYLAHKGIIGSVVHRLRNSMDLAVKNTATLRRKRDRFDDAKIDLMLAQIQESQKLTSQNIRSLALYEKIDQEKSKTPIDLASIVSEVASTYQTHFDDQGIEFTSTMGAYTIYANKEHIRLVFDNLIKNSVEAFGEKKGTHKISLDTKLDDGKVYFTYKDNGPGIPKEVMDKLGSHITSTKPTKGLGIGVMSVFEVLKVYDGVIKYESKEGEGVTITGYIPLGK